MKTTLKLTSALLLLVLLCSAAACAGEIDTEALWQNATYKTDTTLGEGANTVKLRLEAGEKTIVLTIKTDKATLGEALFDLELVSDPIFFDTCNGILADWNRDHAYWRFYVDGEPANYGIGDEKSVTSEEHEYKLVYSKQ